MDGPEQQEMKDVAKEGDLYVVLHRDLLFFLNLYIINYVLCKIH